MKNIKSVNLLKSIIGLLIRGIGVGLMMFASLGLNPATVFQSGFTLMFNLSYGFGAVLVNIIILLIVYLIDKRYIHISSILAIFLIGYGAEYTVVFLSNILKIRIDFLGQLFVLGLGCITMSLGTVIYTDADLGIGALDVFPEMISDKSKYAFKNVRIICDGVFLVLGFIMGGYVGIGTIVSLIVLGPMMQFIRKLQINIKMSHLDYI